MRITRGGREIGPGEVIGDILTWNGNAWVGAAAPAANPPAAGDTLIFNPITNLWQPVGIFVHRFGYGISGTTMQPIALPILSFGGTLQNPALTTAGAYTESIPGNQWLSGVGANVDCGGRGGAGQLSTLLLRGASASIGGFSLILRIAPRIAPFGSRGFFGVNGGTTTLCVAEPSANLNCCGYAWDSTDANWQLLHNDAAGVGTKTDTLAPHTEETVYDIAITADGVDGFSMSLYSVTAAAKTLLHSAVVNTDIPAGSVPMGVNCTLGNAALGIGVLMRFHSMAGYWGP
jgi:hypothetical protein